MFCLAWSLHSDVELDEVGDDTFRLLETLVVEALPLPGARLDGPERRRSRLLSSSDRDLLDAWDALECAVTDDRGFLVFLVGSPETVARLAHALVDLPAVARRRVLTDEQYHLLAGGQLQTLGGERLFRASLSQVEEQASCSIVRACCFPTELSKLGLHGMVRRRPELGSVVDLFVSSDFGLLLNLFSVVLQIFSVRYGGWARWRGRWLALVPHLRGCRGE